MTDTETKNGIIYCRVSSLEQVDGTSLESQERMCREYAKRENIFVCQVFIERGESAKTADRTEFIKAITFCSQKKNPVRYFIVYKLDRFARNQYDHVSVQQTLKKHGTELRSVTEPIGNNPMGKMMEGILSTFAEFDNNVRTERSVNGMRERIKQGIWVWRTPLGYYRPAKGSNIAPDPILASYVRMAFEQYAKGSYTYESLAAYLNKRGFQTKQGNKAIPQLIEKILKNPLYCGIIRIWDMEYKGTFEPVITEQLFYQCQGKPNTRRNIKHHSQNSEFPLRRIALCSICKAPLTGSTSSGRHGRKYAYYHHHKQNCGYAKFIPKETFEQLFVEYLNELSPSLQFEKLFKAIVLDIWKNNFKNFDKTNEQVRKEIKMLEQERQRIFELHRSGVYSDAEFVEQKSIVRKKLADKEMLIHNTRNEEFNMEEALDYCFGFIRESSATWLKLEKKPESRLRFQKLIFEENVEFSDEGFGNGKLTPIYALYQEYLTNESSLLTLRGIEPRFRP